MDKSILLIGAGLSTTHLIEYLASQGKMYGWSITIADCNELLAKSKSVFSNTSSLKLDINEIEQLTDSIKNHDLVISMLPPSLHLNVAKICLEYKKNLLTASYLTDEMKALDREIKNAGLIFLNEIGLDPGIDHLTAMNIIDRLKSEGNYIREFESFTGGLVAPEYENNPWQYKFTWNPKNVVLAGQGGAVKFLQEGQYKYIPYHKIFRRTEIIEIDNYGKFEGYANRDSLKYIETYGLHDIKTMFRGTLRRPGFCKAWDAFVSLGATDDSYIIENSENMTYREFINTFLAYHPTDSVEIKLKYYLHIDQDEQELWEKLEWLDIFKPIKIGLKSASPAQILQSILERKWAIGKDEKDMIVMWHKFVYYKNEQRNELHSSVVVKGENRQHTSMSKTVGLPLGIAAKLILQNKIASKGALIPVLPEFYIPILAELKNYGIECNEKIIT
ncbi:MAG: saccharopine dehydrogenase NADP-binding domain-containing protein [Bacteroidia bacterium]|nr:saccharopine dehydrogenase NADP-binding domain-containing protein [Bacteroidia bacterium]